MTAVVVMGINAFVFVGRLQIVSFFRRRLKLLHLYCVFVTILVLWLCRQDTESSASTLG